LDQQERPSHQGGSAGRRSRSHDPGNRRRSPSYFPGYEAMHAQSLGRICPKPQEGRQGLRPNQVHHRLRCVHWSARQHRRSGAPLRPVLERGWRRSHPQLQEGRRSASRGAGHRRGKGTHLPGYQATGRRPVHQLHRYPRKERRGSWCREVRGCPWRRGATGWGCGRLPARFRILPGSGGRSVRYPEGGRYGGSHDHQRGSQVPWRESVHQGQGSSRTARSAGEICLRKHCGQFWYHQPGCVAESQAEQPAKLRLLA